MSNLLKKQSRVVIMVALTISITIAMQRGLSAEIIDGQFYAIHITKEVKGNKQSTAIKISGKNGYHCNTDFPWSITPIPDANSQFSKKIYRQEDAGVFSDESVLFIIRYFSLKVSTVKAKLKMSLCNDKQCKRVAVELTI